MQINYIEEHRNLQYLENSNYEFKSVEINPIESCTRRCSFCPRSDAKKYPNLKNKVTYDTCKRIALQLAGERFTGRVGFVGFGEPLLHSNLEQCISAFKKYLPYASCIEVNTNGDLLTRERIISLYKAGCTHIAISMYDRDITKSILELKGNIPIKVICRHHYDAKTNYNLNLVNRINITYGSSILNLNSPCYIPFYKLMIDWNGDILPCNNDWSRSIKFGNINEKELSEIINSEEFFKFRAALCSGSRTNIPCSKCNVCGTLRGENEFNAFKKKHGLS